MAIDLTYTRCGDYYIPNIQLSEAAENKPLGKYGRMRKAYLQEYRPALWNSMILSESLYPHLREIDETANRRIRYFYFLLLHIIVQPTNWAQYFQLNTLKIAEFWSIIHLYAYTYPDL